MALNRTIPSRNCLALSSFALSANAVSTSLPHLYPCDAKSSVLRTPCLNPAISLVGVYKIPHPRHVGHLGGRLCHAPDLVFKRIFPDPLHAGHWEAIVFIIRNERFSISSPRRTGVMRLGSLGLATPLTISVPKLKNSFHLALSNGWRLKIILLRSSLLLSLNGVSPITSRTNSSIRAVRVTSSASYSTRSSARASISTIAPFCSIRVST